MNNNVVIENILTRNSIRKFTGAIIPQAKITKILEAAMAAPTANNRRPFHFIVIDDQNLKEQLAMFNPESTVMINSSHLIVVLGDSLEEPTIDFMHHGCAAAVQNILLVAHSLKLGAVWCGASLNDKNQWEAFISENLHLPKHIKPIAIIPLGYPAEKRIVRDRFESERVHINTW